MIFRNSDLKIFDCGAHPKLTKEICNKLSLKPGEIMMKQFADGETQVKINECIRGCDVFLVQPTSAPTNDHLMQLLIVIDAVKRASAARINVVMPYYGYCRQEKKTSGREPITAKLVANLLSVAGADRIICLDLHTGALQGFFDLPFDHLTASFLFKKYVKKKKYKREDIVVVSPDVGGATRARTIANMLKTQMAIIDKRRTKPNECEIMNIVGNIEGKMCILVDDIADTAGTLTKAAAALKKNGAKEIIALCTHPILSYDACEKIEKSSISEFVVTNTIPVNSDKKKRCKKIKVLSVAELISSCIRVIHDGGSITELYDKYYKKS